MDNDLIQPHTSLTHDYSNINTNPILQSDNDLVSLNINKEINNEKLERLKKINQDIQDIREIQNDLLHHIELDSDNLQVISNNIETTETNIDDANENLEAALEYKLKSNRWKSVLVGGTIGAITLGPIGGGLILGLKATGIIAMSGAGLVLGSGGGSKLN